VVIPVSLLDPVIERELITLGLRDKDVPQISMRILRAVSIPAGAITLVSRHADGTIVGARLVPNLFEDSRNGACRRDHVQIRVPTCLFHLRLDRAGHTHHLRPEPVRPLRHRGVVAPTA